jgi:hypothetical protein
LVLASPASDSPLEFVLEVLLVAPELPPLLPLLELLEPHAATPITHAMAMTDISVIRNTRI